MNQETQISVSHNQGMQTNRLSFHRQIRYSHRALKQRSTKHDLMQRPERLNALENKENPHWLSLVQSTMKYAGVPVGLLL